MTDGILEARVEPDDDGGSRVVSPAVGWWADPPADGSPVGPGSVLGRLRVLNRCYALVMPRGATGIVEREPRSRETGVGYGDLLFRLRELQTDRARDRSAGQAIAATGDDDLPPGSHAVRAPTDGVFYGRPSPDAAPFVEAGATVRRGQAVGLVEVMKTFNQIVYDGPGTSDRARVLEIRCGDGDEVSSGQALVVVAPESG